MNSRRVVVVLCGVVLGFAGVRAGSAKPTGDESNSYAAADALILTEVRDHSEAMVNIEYLSDAIGPRLTGSPQLKQAIGADVLAALEQQTGLSQEELLARLSRELPAAVDQYTPDGRLPN